MEIWKICLSAKTAVYSLLQIIWKQQRNAVTSIMENLLSDDQFTSGIVHFGSVIIAFLGGLRPI